MAHTNVQLKGGLDLATPALDVQPGALLESLNVYERTKGGYSTLKGYQRFSGGSIIADQVYYYARLTSYGGDAVFGTQIGDVVSWGGTFSMKIVHRQQSGSQLVLVGTPQFGGVAGAYPTLPYAWDGHSVAEITEGGAGGYWSWETGTSTTFMDAMQSYYRDMVTEVPGAGAVLGVAVDSTGVYAWRADGDGKLFMYRAGGSVWTQIAYARTFIVNTTAATRVAEPGDIVVGGSVAVLQVYDSLTAGAIDPNSKVYLCIVDGSPSLTGTWTTTPGGVNVGAYFAESTKTIYGNGTLDVVKHNFYADPAREALYFAVTGHPAMTYDVANDVIRPITADAKLWPEEIIAVFPHNQRLFMATEGGTYLTSAPGEPTVIDGFLDSQEIGVGDAITGFAATASDNLAIFTRSKTFGMRGISSETWNQQMITPYSGAMRSCIAQMEDVFAADTKGITKLSRTDTLGGFASGYITDEIAELYAVLQPEATCSVVIRSLNQMRFFFGDQFLMATRVTYNANGNEGVRYGMTLGQYDVPVICVWSYEHYSGERTLFGSDDGFVYLADTGTNADGGPMTSVLDLHYDYFKSPLVDKKYDGVEFNYETADYASVVVTYTLDDGARVYAPRSVALSPTQEVFDSGNYRYTDFSSIPAAKPKMPLKGTGRNLKFRFTRTSTYEPQFSLTGYTIRYRGRGLVAI